MDGKVRYILTSFLEILEQHDKDILQQLLKYAKMDTVFDISKIKPLKKTSEPSIDAEMEDMHAVLNSGGMGGESVAVADPNTVAVAADPNTVAVAADPNVVATPPTPPLDNAAPTGDAREDDSDMDVEESDYEAPSGDEDASSDEEEEVGHRGKRKANSSAKVQRKSKARKRNQVKRCTRSEAKKNVSTPVKSSRVRRVQTADVGDDDSSSGYDDNHYVDDDSTQILKDSLPDPIHSSSVIPVGTSMKRLVDVAPLNPKSMFPNLVLNKPAPPVPVTTATVQKWCNELEAVRTQSNKHCTFALGEAQKKLSSDQTLKPYQTKLAEQAINTYLSGKTNGIVVYGLPMGLGKTKLAIMTALALHCHGMSDETDPGKYNRVLVVVPPMLIKQWVLEIEKTISKSNRIVFSVSTTSQLSTVCRDAGAQSTSNSRKIHFLVVGYQCLHTQANAAYLLGNFSDCTVIFDEPHQAGLKDPTSKVFQNAITFFKRCKEDFEYFGGFYPLTLFLSGTFFNGCSTECPEKVLLEFDLSIAPESLQRRDVAYAVFSALTLGSKQQLTKQDGVPLLPRPAIYRMCVNAPPPAEHGGISVRAARFGNGLSTEEFPQLRETIPAIKCLSREGFGCVCVLDNREAVRNIKDTLRDSFLITGDHIFCLYGDQPEAERNAVLKEIQCWHKKEGPIVFATPCLVIQGLNIFATQRNVYGGALGQKALFTFGFVYGAETIQSNLEQFAGRFCRPPNYTAAVIIEITATYKEHKYFGRAKYLRIRNTAQLSNFSQIAQVKNCPDGKFPFEPVNSVEFYYFALMAYVLTGKQLGVCLPKCYLDPCSPLRTFDRPSEKTEYYEKCKEALQEVIGSVDCADDCESSAGATSVPPENSGEMGEITEEVLQDLEKLTSEIHKIRGASAASDD